MDADQLVQRAHDLMRQGDFARARDYLKRAVALAPLRSDIREMLVYALEQESAQADHKPKRERATPLSIAPARRARSSRLLASSAILVVALALIAGGVAASLAYLRGRPLSLPVLAPSEPKPTPAPTPDAESERLDRLIDEAESLAGQAKYEEAIRLMREALQSAPGDPAAIESRLVQMQIDLGKQHYEARRFDEALGALREAVATDPANPECHYWLGQSYYFKGLRESGKRRKEDLQAAERSLKEAGRLDPTMLKAHAALAETCIKLGNPIEGAAYYKRIIEIDPASPEADRARRQLQTMDAQ
ncbi:tetratricopeptide repeat protein [Candidatus Sumerlaeota bacterium]|nr:tetratricopeptide repeat protein [Candidatus Sumerlaeota bacterium]